MFQNALQNIDVLPWSFLDPDNRSCFRMVANGNHVMSPRFFYVFQSVIGYYVAHLEVKINEKPTQRADDA